MRKQSKSKEKAVMVKQEANECSLSLSADRSWMRLVVNGKLIASFHVDYVKKTLAASKADKVSKSQHREHELPASL